MPPFDPQTQELIDGRRRADAPATRPVFRFEPLAVGNCRSGAQTWPPSVIHSTEMRLLQRALLFLAAQRHQGAAGADAVADATDVALRA